MTANDQCSGGVGECECHAQIEHKRYAHGADMSESRKKPKRPKNLLLDPDAVARGERFSRRHGTNLSRLVGDFLRALPLGAEESALSPAVKRLWGITKGNDVSREEYRQHLSKKYGGRSSSRS